MINETLSLPDFKTLPAGHQSAFRVESVRVETLPKNFMMFKLTAGKAQATQWGISPWWSPVMPFKEDDEGALGRFEQARLNGIDLSAMVRFMSAVCIDWNDLDNFVQVKLKDECRAFWGLFAPQKKFSATATTATGRAEQRAKEYSVSNGAQLPPDLGVLEAWQLYVPNLKESDISRSGVIPAHDMHALAIHFGLA
ncbi:hypothetical protein [Falsiroseomonas selenitidurans]|uniref:Uncharacterized protein n=1 Tax=Falsiroseomonas selenitidurans TaxID=2716335 RepID=A0ABX1EEK6_9PROT|nr:hypothetical protein [Falsiroseomonas selenitidurans]NKC34163.1 hypothetical protein [Falsiroseomonas selenitidurans]